MTPKKRTLDRFEDEGGHTKPEELAEYIEDLRDSRLDALAEKEICQKETDSTPA